MLRGVLELSNILFKLYPALVHVTNFYTTSKTYLELVRATEKLQRQMWLFT